MSTLDASAAAVLNAINQPGTPTLDQMDPPTARQALAIGFAALQAPKAEVESVRELAATGPVGPIPLRLYRPKGAAAATRLPALIYFHGGGWVVGDLETHDTLCRLIANAAGCAVVSVAYRLAPEAKFPAAVEDSVAATHWIAAHAAELALDSGRLAVGGDSAGGNLATVTALTLRDAGAPPLKLQVLIYPVTDAHGNTASYARCAEGYFLTRPLMQWFGNHYLNGEAELDDWRVSPLLAKNHAGLPPAHVLVAGFDPLGDEGVAYAKKLEAAGVPVKLYRAEGQIHGFMNMDGAVPEMKTALADIGRDLKAAFA